MSVDLRDYITHLNSKPWIIKWQSTWRKIHKYAYAVTMPDNVFRERITNVFTEMKRNL